MNDSQPPHSTTPSTTASTAPATAPTTTQVSDAPPHDLLPAPRVKRMRWPFPLIWIVPLLAACVAGYYVYQHKEEHGQQVVITFTNASDLKVDDTPVVVHGVRIGTIKKITLADDQRHALVTLDLIKGASHAANQGTKFWIVRPDVSGGALVGLSTLISGPYIEALPGDGPESTEFTGLDEPPVLVGEGMRVVLSADRLEHVGVNSGVYYRGIQVGAVQDIRLAGDSTGVNITVVIWHRFKSLLRTNSKFWFAQGADVHGGIFTGVQFQVNSFRTLLAGGVEFATPDDTGPQAQEGMVFGLNSEPDKKWLKWAPHIAVTQSDVAPYPIQKEKGQQSSKMK